MTFASSYKRPSNAPTPRDERLISDGGWRILSFLVEWDSATTAELGRVVELHIGNIRKQLNMLEVAQLARRDKNNVWRPTVEGREADLERRPTSMSFEIAS